MQQGTDTHTDGHHHNTFRLAMPNAKCKKTATQLQHSADKEICNTMHHKYQLSQMDLHADTIIGSSYNVLKAGMLNKVQKFDLQIRIPLH